MKQWKWLLYAASSLSATINEPLRWEWFTGYRNDQLHWHIKDLGGPITYSEVYKDVQYWENGLVLKTIHRDFVFFARGSYSAFGRGSLQEEYNQFPGNAQFTASTTGWAADASGYVSYFVNLTNGRTYRWMFLPLFGYSGHFQGLERSSPAPSVVASDSSSITSSLPGILHQNWYGFFLGASFQIEPGNGAIFQLGWSYHWLHTRFTTQWQQTVTSGTEAVTTYNRLHLNRGGSLGQTGWMQFDYCFTRYWRAGLGAQVHYFSTSVPTVNSKENGVSVPQKFKLRWTPIDGWAQISREF